MALKILLADDSVTTQNLGKKILADAGYEVVAVSNGAAAVKKIASEKPDILVLDVYMPGYTGLEVCEKVRAAAETANVPVLLTVGKMEPYKAEDGNRVKADGILVKPFEASDLLAAMDRFAKKLQPPAPAETAYDKTVKMAAVAEEDDESYAAWKTDAPEHEEPAHKEIEMTAEAAAAPAFGFDESPAPAAAPAMEFGVAAEASAPAFGVTGGAAAAPAFEMPAADVPPPPPPFEMPAAEAAAFEMPHAAPAFEVPAPEAAPAFDLTAHAAEPAPVLEVPAAPAFDASDAPTAEISVPAELEYNAAAPVDVAVSAATELETTAVAPTPDVVVAQDSALVTNAEDMAQFATKFGVENPEVIPVGVAQPETAETESGEQVVAAIPDLSVESAPAYQDTQKIEPPVEEAPESEAVVLEPEVAEVPAPAAVEVAPSVEVDAAPAIEAPAVIEEPAAEAAVPEIPAPAEQPAPVAAAPAASVVHEEEPHFMPGASNMSLEEEMRRAFSSLPVEPAKPEGAGEAASAAAASAGADSTVAAVSDDEKVALALERVVDRFRDQLIAEIKRELKRS